MKQGQAGMALITVLLVMGLALLLTAAMLREQRLMVRSSALQLHTLQLRQWVISAEGWAKAQLPRQPGPVASSQQWALAQPPWRAPGGLMEVAIEDLAGRVNTPSQGPSLSDRHNPQVSHLPRHVGLNINTASLDSMLASGLAPEVARRLIAERPRGGYSSVKAAFNGQVPSAPALSVTSRWFQVRVRATLGDHGLLLVSDFELARNGREPLLRQRRLLPISGAGGYWP